MKNPHLVLTGVEQEYVQTQDISNVYYLGPWAFGKDYQDYFINKSKYNMIPSPYTNYSDFKQASVYINNLYKRISPLLHCYLNKIHKVEHSEVFWKVLTLPYVVTWLGIFYDRYSCLISAVNYLNTQTNVSVISNYNYKLKNFNDISVNVSDHYFNWYLFSVLIKIPKLLNCLMQ